MNKLFVFALIATFCTMAFAQAELEGGFTIDQASALLNDLLDDAQQNLADLEKNWDAQKPILEALIDNLKDQVHNKQSECDALGGSLGEAQNNLSSAQKFAAWLRQRIHDNNASIESLLAKRCAQNGIYIEGLKNDKITLKLIQFLRDQISNKQSFDLAQKKIFFKNLHSFVSAYKSKNFEVLIQMEKKSEVSQFDAVNTNTDVRERTADEIGSGHLDNNQGDLELQGFGGDSKGWLQIQAELLQLLDNLEVTVISKMAQAQTDEVNSNITTADFKLKLQEEVQSYAEELAKVESQIVGLEGAVVNAQASVDQCNAENSEFNIELINAQNNLDGEIANFNAKRAELNEEISIFNEVINLYLPTSEDEALKSRVADYTDNESFDDTEYSAREIPEIDLINGL